MITDLQGMEAAFARVIERGQQDGSISTLREASEIARVLAVAVPGLQVMVRAGCEAATLDARFKAVLAILG